MVGVAFPFFLSCRNPHAEICSLRSNSIAQPSTFGDIKLGAGNFAVVPARFDLTGSETHVQTSEIKADSEMHMLVG